MQNAVWIETALLFGKQATYYENVRIFLLAAL
jgi:hypothetical protein